MSLGLVIPVWNDQAALDRLLHNARSLGIFDQILVVDDGSDPPVRPDADLRGPDCEIIRREVSGGAGVARNAALERIATTHVLFFDSDDLMTPELPRLWREVQAERFDFCLFRHADSRVVARGVWDQMPHDSALWRRAGQGGVALRQAPRAALGPLAETANYPWNKIYRTGFLRDHGLRCSETRVHNDILLHWLSFLAADRVLVSDRIAALHHVATGRDRLTNRRGAERLVVFEPLAAVWQALRKAPDDKADLRLAFLRFASGLLVWVRDHLDPALHGALEDGARGFLTAALEPEAQAEVIHRDPVLALRLALQMAGRVPVAEPAPC